MHIILVQLRGHSQSWDQKYPQIYKRWVLSVLGAGVPTKAHIILGSITWVLSVLGAGVPTEAHIILGSITWVLSVLGAGVPTKVLIILVQLRGHSQSWDQKYPHIYKRWVLSVLGAGVPTEAHTIIVSITWVLSVLGSEVPTHILEVCTLSPRSRGTHQGAHNSWFNYVGTLSPRIKSNHSYTRGGYSQS